MRCQIKFTRHLQLLTYKRGIVCVKKVSTIRFARMKNIGFMKRLYTICSAEHIHTSLTVDDCNELVMMRLKTIYLKMYMFRECAKLVRVWWAYKCATNHNHVVRHVLNFSLRLRRRVGMSWNEENYNGRIMCRSSDKIIELSTKDK